MIKVCGYRVLVKPILLEESDDAYKRAKALGLEVARDAQDKKREHESVDKGTVVQVGSSCFKADDFNGETWAKVGDNIVYARGAGKLVIDEDTLDKYIVINDVDIVAVTKEAE